MNTQNQWDFDGFDQSMEVNPSFTFPFGEKNDYFVKLKVTSDKKCMDSTSRVIAVRVQALFYVPNAFTPDGDDKNNIFSPVMTAGVDPQHYNLKIYNRWGETLFESNNFWVGWDGTYGGKVVKEGVYTWKINFTKLNSSNVITQKGTVVLIK